MFNLKGRKTKEQKEQEKKAEENTTRLRTIVKEKIFPLLEEKSKNIEDAKMMCAVLSAGIQQAHANLSTTMRVSEFHLENMLSKESTEEFERFKALLDLVQDETLADAKRLIGDMPTFIDGCIRKESMERKLSEFKVELL